MTADVQSRWYVVQTHANAEAKAYTHLEKQGFQAYLPRFLKRRRHARRVETVPAPLFPCYLFVTIDVATQRGRSIHSTIRSEEHTSELQSHGTGL
jgi:transcriptional antiterminator RfaH